MKKNFTILRSALIAAGLISAQTAFCQSSAAPSPDSGAPAGSAESEGPSSKSPFAAITSTGDPFGAISTSAIPSQLSPSAGGFMLGGVGIYPVIGVGLRYDDNIFLSNANKKSSTVAIVSPAVRAQVRDPGGSTYGITYKADLGRYFDSAADNYNDQSVVADANVVVSTRARLALRFEYLDLHDPRGSTDRANSAEPDQWHAPGASATFSYGTPGARGRVELEAGHNEKRYDNNRTFTAGSDRNTNYVGGTFYWRVMPATSLLLQAKQTAIDYRFNPSGLDSKERRYYAGVTWDATAKTSGTIRAGYLEKDFSNTARQDFSGTSWQGRVRWSPLTYSVFEVTTGRETNEATGIGDYILSSLVYGTWTHAWNSVVKTNVLLGYRRDDFRGSGAVRKDDTTSAGVGATYQMRRWLNFGAQYIYTDRSSNTAAFEYQRNVFMLTVGGTL